MRTNTNVNILLYDALQSAADELGTEVTMDLKDIGEYTEEQAKLLASSVGTPAFPLALQAARDNIALRSGIMAVNNSRMIQQRLLGVLHGVLYMAARSIALGVL